MKRINTLGVAVLASVFLAVPALGQTGTLCILSDVDGQSCVFDDTTPGEIAFHVIHTKATSVTGVQFSAPIPSCMGGATFLSDDWMFPVTIGSSQSDIAVAYGGCLASPLHILTIRVFGQGTSSPDCAYPVLPAQGMAVIEAAGCDNNLYAIPGGTAYINSTLACDCPDGTSSGPALEVTPGSLSFAFNEVHQTLDVTNAGTGTLEWQVFRDQPWLSLSPTNGIGDGTIDVTVKRFDYPDGEYAGSITVSSNGGATQIPVTMTVRDTTPPMLSVTPLALSVGASTNETSFMIQNDGGGTLSWNIAESIPWLALSETTGTGPRTIRVTIDRTGLPNGTYNGEILVASNGGNETVLVDMLVAPPMLSVSPTVLDFGTTQDQGAFSISNAGGGLLEWTISESISWATLSMQAGTGDGTIVVDVDRSNLVPGMYEGAVDIASNGGNATVTLKMTVPDPLPSLGFGPRLLNFAFDEDSLQIVISNFGGSVLQWSITTNAPWLGAAPGSGSTPANSGGQEIAVFVDRTGLADGTYDGNLFITSNGGNGIVVVTMEVNNTPVLSLTQNTLNFGFFLERTLGIRNLGGGVLQWAISADQPWILIDPPLTGLDDANVTVRVDVGQIPGGGQQTGHVIVTSNAGNAVANVIYDPAPSPVPGVLGVYADAQGIDCAILDAAAGLLPVYVVHTATPGVAASQFSAPLPTCWSQSGAVYLADAGTWPVTIGTSQTGVAIGYGTCLASPIHALTINYFVQGTGAPCCEYPVLPDPNVASGRIEVVDCANGLLFGSGASAYINPDGTCGCGGTVPVHDTTWGQVKSLFAPPRD